MGKKETGDTQLSYMGDNEHHKTTSTTDNEQHDRQGRARQMLPDNSLQLNHLPQDFDADFEPLDVLVVEGRARKPHFGLSFE
jgi:hypothetical protein